MFDKVTCGCRKWYIGIDDDANVVVHFGSMAGHVDATLFDSYPKEWRELAEMFTKAADYFDALRKVREVERQTNKEEHSNV